MPPSDTICISFGNWVVAFYVVYVMAVIALLSVLAFFVDQCVSKIGRSWLTNKRKVSRQGQIIESRA